MPRAVGQDILLDTAIGTPVPNSQTFTIGLPLAAQALVRKVLSSTSILRTLPNPRYNCHGLSLGARRTAILEDATVTYILSDDGYQPIQPRDVLPGDLAIYYAELGAIDHSAIVVSRPESPTWIPFVISKWGVIGPEVFHLATDPVPGYAVADIRYYRIIP